MIPILLALVLIGILLLVIIAGQPDEFTISRSAKISALPEKIFPYVNELKKWDAWSPWAKLDPNCKITFAGPDAGVNSSYTWAGNNKVGAGQMTIIESVPSSLIRLRLEFLKPFKATNTAEFKFTSEGRQTFVVWSMTGKSNFFFKGFGLFMDCDTMAGKDFKKGLGSLKVSRRKPLELVSEPSVTSAAPPPVDIPGLADHLFRHEAAKLVAVLTGIFGIERLQLAEDVVQEVMARALQTWPYYGVPKNPAAWLTQAAKNLALDTIRREKIFREKQPQIIAHIEQLPGEAEGGNAPAFESEIKDDRLRMMFVCCHPLVSREDQVALALKTLCGFSPPEIAKAFLTTEAAIAKRLTRAKQRIREAGIRFEIPEGDELARRLDAVLQSLYLLFNEGYKASSGETLIREDLCREAIRLTQLLAEHPAGIQPKTHALLALMLLNAARIPSRTDSDGNLLRLQEQDRSRWNQPMIARGMFHLAQSAAGEELSEYHLQAGIAACHCAAQNYAATDWPHILELYDRLVEFDDSPVVALNRAVAVAEVQGPQAGIEAVGAIRNLQSLESYYLLHAVLGEFEARLKHSLAAAAHFRKAMQLAEIKSEQAFLSKRLLACEQGDVGL